MQGFTTSMIFGMGAVFANIIGMTNQQGSIFLASFTIANVVMQYPVGRMSDRFDRRLVILIVTSISALASAIASIVGLSNYWTTWAHSYFWRLFNDNIFAVYCPCE